MGGMKRLSKDLLQNFNTSVARYSKIQRSCNPNLYEQDFGYCFRMLRRNYGDTRVGI